MTMDQHLARVRLLSNRFLELQGLRVASAGATIAIVFGGYLATGHPSHTGGMIALGATFALMLPGQWWAHRYYATTIGRQVPKPRKFWPTLMFLNGYWLIAVYLNRRFPEIPAGAPTAATVVLASLFVAIRDWPWRVHYVGVAVAVATALGSNVIGVDAIDRGMALTMTFFVTGVSMIPAGLLDHRLLMKLIRETQQPVATGG